MHAFLLALCILPIFGDETVDKALNVLNPNGTSEGPDENWVKERLERYGQKGTSSFKKSRIAKGDLNEKLKQIKELTGEKAANKTEESAKGESHPDLLGVALEGDMLLNPDQIDAMTGNSNSSKDNSRERRSCTTNPRDLWPLSQPVSYIIDPSLASIAYKIRAGVQFWQTNSCIRFLENGNTSPRIRYYRGSGCWSYIGKQPWTSQDISIGFGCESTGTICHETAHAMGFFHTQSRYDRDSYLQINFANIQTSQQHNFVKQTPATETHFGMKYDYGSVMQYDPYAFALNSNVPTSIALDAKMQNLMGQRVGPSFSDVKQMNILYNCAGRCSKNITCKHNGIMDSNTCNSCICPSYFDGTYCDNLRQGSAAVCNAVKLTPTSSYQTFTAQVGPGSTQSGLTVDCYWVIQAQPGQTVTIQIRSLTASCVQECGYGGFEINMGNLDLRGFLTCCSSITSYSFTSTTHLVLIRGTAVYGNVSMQIMYKTA